MTTHPDGSVDTGTPSDTHPRGRTTVKPRALNSLVCAVTADIFGVDAKAVDVNLSDHNGLLALTIATPVPGAGLNRTHRPDLATPTKGGNILHRVTHAHTAIRERVSALGGAEVGHVTIRVSGIETGEVREIR